ncbi:MAG: nicotinate-nucleotide adenylyltransferase [Defluviitaleaceae bacterium]|nr:nicotinate-nucleotide adenylyltransferase [Defluviitaleaceae bacterium]
MKYKREERDYLDRCHSLAVYGGTFDPIHMGHLAVAEAVYQQLKPQRVLFMPCGQPAHKYGKHRVSHAKHRYHMTALAVCEHPAFDISQLELNRPGLSYTIDTARALQAHCPPGAEISFIIGADALGDILSWKDADILLKQCRFIAVPRPGYESTEAINKIETLKESYGAIITWLEAPVLDISSTEVRERFKKGQPVHGFVPKWVEDYALCHGLYRTEDPYKKSTLASCFEEAKESLRIRLSPKRFTHTMGVVKEAERLAVHYKADTEKARWAALLHDCAKEYSSHKKHTLCKLWRIELDEALTANIDIAHGLIGAESARRDFLIDDEEILQAIRYHTTGHKGMTILDKIIMLADYIEPNRENWGPIQEMRGLALTNINQALILGTKATIAEEKSTRKPVHPWSYDAMKVLKKGLRKKGGH